MQKRTTSVFVMIIVIVILWKYWSLRKAHKKVSIDILYMYNFLTIKNQMRLYINSFARKWILRCK